MVYLIGDIGGTKTHLALYDGKVLRNQKFASGDYDCLAAIAKEFLANGEKIEKACFGIAGPVRDGRCQATNLPWVIDAVELGKELGIESVYLLNDLEANAWGINSLREDQFYVLNKGDPTKGNCALISAGTGLGEAGIYYTGAEHRPFATEGGHADFAPRSDLEIELLCYLRKRFKGHVSYERILSGPGLGNVYRFLVDVKGYEDVLGSVEEKLLPKMVSERGLEKGESACQKALEIFVDLYGAEAGNVALKFLTLGGIYVGGGIAPKILPAIQKGTFMKSFCDKGRFEGLLKSVPVRVILEENTALLGSGYFVSRS
ncbi:MAG: glucokinase [Chlamydiales bacterium]|nr:glucokinase [Chlamydiales bacterium]